MGKTKISVIIIARNEEADLPDCLELVEWADEIVLIDNGSTDKTAKIAKDFGARVYAYDKEASLGYFSEIRNFAVKKSGGEWVLFIDADERVGHELKEEIQSVVVTSEFAGYAIPRKNILLGREMKYGGWRPDYVLRLIRKNAFEGYVGKLHEQPKITGEIGKLKNPLTHITHKDITEMIEKTNKWSEIEAKLLFDSGHPKMNIIRFFTAGTREFWYRAIRKLGFLDGTVGWIEICYQTYSRLITYAKLWDLQLKKIN